MGPTSRVRHKSAPYLRLKNCKRSSKCQVFSFTVPEKLKSCTKLARRGTFSAFLKFILLQIIKKIEDGPFGEKNFQKSTSKKTKGDPSVSPCTEKVHTRYIPTIVRYTGKEIQPFWFSYLDQMVQFRPSLAR